MTAWTSCADCQTPVALLSTGWYRCRQCGHESLREPVPVHVPWEVAEAELYSRDEREYVHAVALDDLRAAEGGAGLVSLFDK